MKAQQLEGMNDVKVGAPIDIEQQDFHSSDGVFIKRIRVPKGALVGQHVHAYSHATIVGRGIVTFWRGKALVGDFGAGSVLTIDAGVAHQFYGVEDADIYCVHNEAHALTVEGDKLEPT